MQLINAVDFAASMRKSLGNKRKYFTDEHITQITDIFAAYEEGQYSKIFDNQDFGYTKVTVERPVQEDKNLTGLEDLSGLKRKPNTSLRDYEKIPLKDDIDAYFEREVLPHVAGCLDGPR